jgi:hypothetical protein
MNRLERSGAGVDRKSSVCGKSFMASIWRSCYRRCAQVLTLAMFSAVVASEVPQSRQTSSAAH